MTRGSAGIDVEHRNIETDQTELIRVKKRVTPLLPINLNGTTHNNYTTKQNIQPVLNKTYQSKLDGK